MSWSQGLSRMWVSSPVHRRHPMPTMRNAEMGRSDQRVNAGHFSSTRLLHRHTNTHRAAWGARSRCDGQNCGPGQICIGADSPLASPWRFHPAPWHMQHRGNRRLSRSSLSQPVFRREFLDLSLDAVQLSHKVDGRVASMLLLARCSSNELAPCVGGPCYLSLCPKELDQHNHP